MTFISKNLRKRSFSFESEATKSFIRTRGMHLYCPIMKKKRLLRESMFIPIERQTSILKMVERDVLLLNPRHQNRLSQQGECVYSAQS